MLYLEIFAKRYKSGLRVIVFMPECDVYLDVALAVSLIDLLEYYPDMKYVGAIETRTIDAKPCYEDFKHVGTIRFCPKCGQYIPEDVYHLDDCSSGCVE